MESSHFGGLGIDPNLAAEGAPKEAGRGEVGDLEDDGVEGGLVGLAAAV